MKKLKKKKINANDNYSNWYNDSRNIESQIRNVITTLVNDLNDQLLQLREEYIQLYGAKYLDVIEREISYSIAEYRPAFPKDEYRKEYDKRNQLI